MLAALTLVGCRDNSVREYNTAFFDGVAAATGSKEPRATYVRFVGVRLNHYNEKVASNADERIRANDSIETLLRIVAERGNRHRPQPAELRLETVICLLSLREDERSFEVLRQILNDDQEHGFVRIHAALALAYRGDKTTKPFLEKVLKGDFISSSSGFELSYAALGLHLLGELPAEFKFGDTFNPLFPHLDNR
jgi:HEAT repeat protein